MKRLELQAMRADLATVQGAIEQHTRDADPLGWRQFSRRADLLRERIRQFEDTPTRTATVALLFGGRPVLGSHGIDAVFGSKAVGLFQDVVSTRYAANGGQLGARGPIANRHESDLVIRDVARGSFGFVLEESSTEQLVNSPLKDVMKEVLDVIYRVSAPDEEAFEQGLDDLDSRLLAKLREFYQHLDRSNATMRLVDDDREYSLDRDDIQRGRERTEGASITEEEPAIVTGRLFILPADRRFELHPAGGGETMSGAITPECMIEITGLDGLVKPNIIGQELRCTLLVKTVRTPNHDPKRTYKLNGIQA